MLIRRSRRFLQRLFSELRLLLYRRCRILQLAIYGEDLCWGSTEAQCSLYFEREHFGRLIRDRCSWARIVIHIAEHNAGGCFLWFLLMPGGLIAEISFSNNGSRVLR